VTRVLYPGSFDPVHNGHVEVVGTAARLFDEVVVATMHNPEKAGGFFPLDVRLALLRDTFASLGNVEVVARSGLLVDVATELRVDFVLKGLRSAADFDIEMQMAHTNHAVARTETLFLPTTPATSFISSRFVREIAGAGGDVSSLVPAAVQRQLLEQR
jgi:pantetheine-phosphate adenylyltransferase